MQFALVDILGVINKNDLRCWPLASRRWRFLFEQRKWVIFLFWSHSLLLSARLSSFLVHFKSFPQHRLPEIENIWYLIFDTCYSIFDIRYLIFDIWYSTFNIQYLPIQEAHLTVSFLWKLATRAIKSVAVGCLSGVSLCFWSPLIFLFEQDWFVDMVIF